MTYPCTYRNRPVLEPAEDIIMHQNEKDEDLWIENITIMCLINLLLCVFVININVPLLILQSSTRQCKVLAAL